MPKAKKITKSTVIGIDIKGNVIRFATMKTTSPMVVSKYGEIILPSNIFKNGLLEKPENLIEEIKLFLKRGQNLTGPVVYSALNSKILIKKFLLEGLKNEQEIRKHLYLELGDSIAVPFEKPVFDLLMIERQNENFKKNIKRRAKKKNLDLKKVKRKRTFDGEAVNFVATSEDELIQRGDCLSISGYTPIGVDINSIAILRVIGKKKLLDSIFLLVEVDCGTITFTVFENGLPIYVQYEEYNLVNWKTLKNSSGDMEQQFNEEHERRAFNGIGEIINNINYYYGTSLSDNKALKNIVLVGENPLIDNDLCQIIEEQTGINTEISNVKVKDKRGNKLPLKYMLAVGLAMKGA